MNNGAKYMANMKGMRRKVLIMAFGLLLIIMSFTGFVNFMTFADNYNKSLVNTYSVAGNELVRKIEYSLHYGKPIDNFYGMNETLNELKVLLPEMEQVKIISPSGAILYDLKGFVNNQRLPGDLQKAAVFEQGTINENLSYKFYDQKAYLFIAIKDSTSQHVASLTMVFPEETFLQINSQFTRQLLAYLGGIALIALVLLAIIFFQTKLFNQDNLIDKKKVLIALITVIGSAQLFYSGINYMFFKDAYIDMANTSKVFLEKIVGENIASVSAKGLGQQNVEGLDEYLASIKSSLPQIEDIRMVPSSESASANPQAFNQVQASISNAYIDQQMFKILLDMLTVLLISILFMIEITLLAVILMTRGPTRALAQENVYADVKTSHGLVRSLTYFVNVCACMSLTFVPIVMKNLYEPVLGLPKDVVLGLPLSAEMLGGILAIIFAGRTINKQGWKAIVYQGAVFLALGNLLSGLGAGAVPFILARALAGFGLGYILMSIRSLVVSLPETNAAIAEFSAGAIAGLNCGAVMGGMLADRIGYDVVFYLIAVLAVIPFIFVRKLMNEFQIEERETSDISAWAKFVNFIADKKTILFLICIFIPYFISGAFLDYYFPLFASSHELSQSDISRGFLLNGLFIIYLGPILTRYIGQKLGDTKGLIVSMLIVVCALTNFVLLGTVMAAFITLILLGIAESFGVSMKTTYFLNLNGIKDLEINKGIAYFSIMVNLSRMAGPIVFGMALSLGARMGVGLISLIIMLLLLAFVISTGFNKTSGQAATD